LADDSRGDCIDVICGPTAAGKSAIALTLGLDSHIAILSADSRQIYQGFDIGTAKPTPEERVSVPHFGIDLVTPAERYSASAWAGQATRWIAAARAEGRAPLIVGGTGFYIRALVDPLFQQPPLDPERRAQLAAYLDGLSTLELRRWCQAIDPARSPLGRTQLLRALEIAVLTGQRVSELHVQASRISDLRARYLVVDPGTPLSNRVEQRIRRMIKAGWPDEVRDLVTHWSDSAPAWNATGYRELHRWVRGECTLDEAIARIVIATRQYAKRQRTWFRHQLPAESVTTVNPDDAGAAATVRSWWADRRRAA